MSETAAISPYESNFGGRGGCLGFLVYLFSAQDHPEAKVIVASIKYRSYLRKALLR
jgi:hypothetical protein